MSAMPQTDWIGRALAAAALTGIALVACSALAQAPGNFSTLTADGTAILNGDVLICSGRPWIDVRCPNMAGGAVADGNHDDTAAIQAAIDVGIANNWPVHLSAGTYKVASTLTIDYAGQASRGFRLVSEGATIDGRAIATGPVLRVLCSGGVPGAPADCFYFKQEGVLFVLADTPDYAVVIGNDDFSDAHNTIKLDHLNVNNRNTDLAAGGCRFNYVLDSDLWAACVSAGGGAGLALEQTQFSRISVPAPRRAPAGGASCLKMVSTTLTRFLLSISKYLRSV